MRLKKDHDGADGFVLLPAFADELNAARADALDLFEKRRTFINHGQGAFAEDFDNFVGQIGANAFHKAGTEIFFDAFKSLRRRAAQLIGFELLTVIAVAHPGAGRLDVFAGRDRRHSADDGDEAAPAARLDAQHREPGIGIVKGDALDNAGQQLGHAFYCTGVGMLKFAMTTKGWILDLLACYDLVTGCYPISTRSSCGPACVFFQR